MTMYTSIPEALEIYRKTDPNKVYAFQDKITKASVTGLREHCEAFILAHDEEHKDVTKWLPVDDDDVEAWALLEAIYN